MKIPINWLKDFVKVTIPVEELAERLTLAGLEVTGIDYVGIAPTQRADLHGSFAANEAPQHEGLVWDREKIVVAQIREVRAHPNADRLVLADVDYGAEQLHPIVTGAPNIFHLKGQGPLANGPKVIFAKEGAQLYDGHQPGRVLMTLKPTKIRGVRSDAMVCSEKELGVSDEHEGIILLDDDAPVGTPAADYLGDAVLDIDILPNIARAMSILGVAREVAALTGQKLRYPSFDVKQNGPSIKGQIEIVIRNPDLNPRFTAMLIKDVAIGPSPYWMQYRLRLAGMRPISNIVDVTNYVMLELGQPTHAFDYDKLVERAKGKTPTIITRVAKPGERLLTLDSVDRPLDDFTVLVTDKTGALSIGGIMGGGETEVSDTTANVLLEAANWNFINIRKTAQAQKLQSEAASRFGRGVHPSLALLGVKRGIELMRQLSGGAVAKGVIDVYPNKAKKVKITLTTTEVERILGFSIPVKQMTRLLESLEFEVKPIEPKSKGKRRSSNFQSPVSSLQVTVPDHRLDCAIPEDLIEEIARIYGYDRIPRTPMKDEMPPQRGNADLDLEEQVRDVLIEMGLYEIITHSMTTPAREALLLPSGARPDDRPYLGIANPISSERTHMRHTLLSSVLDNVASNVRHHDRVMVFELNKIYLESEEGPLPEEPRRLTIAMSGPREPESWQSKDDEWMDFYDIKGVIEGVIDALHISGARYEASDHPSYHPGRAARLILQTPEGDRVAGHLGEVHPLVRDAFDLPHQAVLAAELDYELLKACATPDFRVHDVPRHPALTEDLAFIVRNDLPAERVQAAIWEAGDELLRQVVLFDVYRGEQIGSGNKSLAYRLTYQAPDRTLTDAEVAKMRERIVRRLQQSLNAMLRG
jgi:phenylalanyl-tRNA synthetase beta chain